MPSALRAGRIRCRAMSFSGYDYAIRSIWGAEWLQRRRVAHIVIADPGFKLMSLVRWIKVMVALRLLHSQANAADSPLLLGIDLATQLGRSCTARTKWWYGLKSANFEFWFCGCSSFLPPALWLVARVGNPFRMLPVLDLLWKHCGHGSPGCGRIRCTHRGLWAGSTSCWTRMNRQVPFLLGSDELNWCGA